MKKIANQHLLLGAALAVMSAVGTAQTNARAAGHWEGKIQIPEHELGITVDLARVPDGGWTGSMSVLKSSAVDVPLKSIAVQDGAVRFEADLPARATFEGRLSEDGSNLSGSAANSEGAAPFQLARNGDANVKLPPPSSFLTREFEGAWEGYLDVGGKVTRVRLTLVPADGGIATATLIVIEPRTQEIPVTTVTIRDQQLQVEARAVSGAFRGTLGPGGDISGEWAEGPNHIPLTFKRLSTRTDKP
jgi:hypothetical protein